MKREKELSLVTVAKIAGPFGVKGEVRVKTNSQLFAEYIMSAKKFSLANGGFLTPIAVRELQDGFAFFFKEIADRNAAERLPRDFLQLPREDFPQSEGLNVFFEDDILNFNVLFGAEKIGVISGFHDFGAAPVIAISEPDGSESMLALIEANVENLNGETGELILSETGMQALAAYPKIRNTSVGDISED